MKFNNIVRGCFRSGLEENYVELIEEFKVSYLALNLTIPTKAHVIFCHLSQYLNHTGRGLSLDAEQALESSHFDFLATNDKYAIRDHENQNFLPRLHRAVCDYNGSHI